MHQAITWANIDQNLRSKCGITRPQWVNMDMATMESQYDVIILQNSEPLSPGLSLWILENPKQIFDIPIRNL